MYVPPKNDLEYSRQRLDRIMGSARLRFNPYRVSDERLLEIVDAGYWGDEYDLTQILTMTFTRLREVNDSRKFDGIYMRIGLQEEEVFIPTGTFTHGVTANDTVRNERSRIGKKSIRNENDVASLVGKRVFVSHVIRGVNMFGAPKCAYRMRRLSGKPAKDAELIRHAIIESKIEMLERVLSYPESPDYLSCRKNLFDYESRILRAISLIRQFPLTAKNP